jgi:hypothetical protein
MGENCPRDAQGRLCGKGEPAHRKERDGKETTVFADAGILPYSFMMESAEDLSFTCKFALLDIYLTHSECPSSIRTLRWSIATRLRQNPRVPTDPRTHGAARVGSYLGLGPTGRVQNTLWVHGFL